MGKGLYWKGETEVGVDEVLTQQGLVQTATHQELAIAAADSMDLMLEVLSSCHVKARVWASGEYRYTFNRVDSFDLGAGSSVDARWTSPSPRCKT